MTSGMGVDINKVCIAVYADDYCIIIQALCTDKSKIDITMVIFKLVFFASNWYHEQLNILKSY